MICEGSGVKKLVPKVLCSCGKILTVVDNKIPEHENFFSRIVNGCSE